MFMFRLFLEMKLIELKYGLFMLFLAGLMGIGGIAVIAFPILVVTIIWEAFFPPGGPEPDWWTVCVTGFALGLLTGLPHVAEIFGQLFKEEIEPLRELKSELRPPKSGRK